MAENNTIVQQAFRILQPQLSGYIAREMSREYPRGWWQEVLLTLNDQIRDLPDTDDFSEQVDSLDIANCLRLFDRKWGEVFRKKLSPDYRSWAKELMGVRNKLAHIGTKDFSDKDTWRALDTMARLCSAFDDEAAEEISSLLRKTRYGSSNGSTDSTVTAPISDTAKNNDFQNMGVKGLQSWRDIIEPHPDVAQGRYKNAEFAADLSQVARGEGSFEYRDPVEFFARTYVTEGMKGLMIQALKRVTGADGEPVIQLKTAFGGGKTHSMLALYHLMKAKVPADKIPSIKPILQEVGLSTMPKANVAVLVGTAIDPTKSKRPINLPGITINTLWGEMAAQLVESSGDMKLYDYVKESDKKGVSPGSEALKELFDACGPCLILMDELVAYAKRIYGVSGLPAGSFDNFISFIQEITEAARASKNSIVVASIPESDIEIGGEAGKKAIDAIEHTFGRMESIWKPVAANEGFEVVRRRLFLPCKDVEGRDAVCNRFSEFYAQNDSDFPIEAKEVDYRERMKSCYPIHPEIFDRLYNDWSTLERFQRTRGVLRLMAAVIHELWIGGDTSAMIMPGSIPLSIQNVSYELTRHLGDDNWNAIIDSEVDGKASTPFRKDKEVARYGQYMASRRVTRTIFLGSAPSSRDQAVRGIEASRIRLGAIQPGQNISTFNDAMNALQSTLAYLYTNSSGDRYWFDTRPTLRKTAEDRATQIPVSDVEYEMEKRLRSTKRALPFEGIYSCPASSLDVPDEQKLELVVLRPDYTYKPSDINCPAMKKVEDILNNRGAAPRIYRNMLAFIAPDSNAVSDLKEGVRKYLAWKSIQEDSDDLNLDTTQLREVKNSITRSNETVEARINEAYCWVLIPYIDRAIDMKEITWESYRISGGNESIYAKAAEKMIETEALIDKWAPALLLIELDSVLWKDSSSINIKKLWDYLCTYCYLPRLASYSVLEETILRGVNSSEYFALAAGIMEERFVDLRYNQEVGAINKSDYLVKIVDALKQIAFLNPKDSAIPETPQAEQQKINHGENPTPTSTQSTSEELSRHFYMSATLDNTRINRDVQKLVEEVIQHLTVLDNCDVSISLEVTATDDTGFTQSTVRTISENCKTLHVNTFGFEK